MPFELRTCLAAAVLSLSAGLGQAQTGQFLAISDVHLVPFNGGAQDADLAGTEVDGWDALFQAEKLSPSKYGADANVALFKSAVSDAASRVSKPDFIVYPGDFVMHHLSRVMHQADAQTTQAQIDTIASKTTLYLGDTLMQAFPGVTILPTLGNTDAGCGDYRIEPGGAYLTATWPMIEKMVGMDWLAADAEDSWKAGGYYRATHPTVAGAQVLVLNNIFWSPNYQDSCGTATADYAKSMLDWADKQLTQITQVNQKAWLIYHMPPGVDAYSTAHKKPAQGAAPSCGNGTVTFKTSEYNDAFQKLMEKHAAVIETGFAGHIHRDSFRLFRDGNGTPYGYTNIIPSISPIYGNNPAYQVFDYDAQTGSLTDKTTYRISNLVDAATGAPAKWVQEYQFSKAYALGSYGMEALNKLAGILETDARSPDRARYAGFYMAGNGNDPASNWPVYACAVANVSVQAFEACRCPAN